MRYTKYFSSVIKQFGGLNLKQEALQTLFNIVYLEAQLNVYEQLNQEKRFGIQIHRIKDQLHLLTGGGLDPKILLKHLHYSDYSKPTAKGNRETTNEWDEFDPYLEKPRKRYQILTNV